MFSIFLPYLPLEGQLEEVDRSNIFFLSRLPSETNYSQIVKQFLSFGLGDIRVTWIDKQSAYVTILDRELAVNTIEKIEASDWKVKISPLVDSENRKEGDRANPEGSKRSRID